MDKDFRTQFTRTTYKPDYIRLGYSSYSYEIGMGLMDILYARAVFKTYTGINVSVNDLVKLIENIDDIEQVIANSAGTDEILKFQVRDSNKDRGLHWNVSIAFHNGDLGFQSISLINGIVVSSGTHIDHIINQLVEPFKEKIKKDMKLTRWSRAIVDKYLYIGFRAAIQDPRYEGQAKNQLKYPSSFPDHNVTDATCKKFYSMIKTRLEAASISKSADQETKKKSRVSAKKYVGAEKAGSKESYKCKLFIPEGDSAELLVRTGITDKRTGFGGFKYYGIFNIQGKPMNARESKVKKDTRR